MSVNATDMTSINPPPASRMCNGGRSIGDNWFVLFLLFFHIFFKFSFFDRDLPDLDLDLKVVSDFFLFPANIWVFKVNNRNTKIRYERFFIINFEQISHIVYCSGVSIVDLEQVNVCWVENLQNHLTSNLRYHG